MNLRSVHVTIRPLQWDRDRTPPGSRVRAFSASWSSTVDVLDRELHHLGAKNIVLQIDVSERDIRRDGWIRADARPATPAVRLIFDSRHGELGYSSDRQDTWQGNVRAIALGLEALRKVDRYGIGQGSQYRGYRELTTGAPTKLEACATLARAAWPNEPDEYQRQWAPKIATDPTIAKATYREARARSHPDRHNGDHGPWYAVDAAARALGLTS